MIPVYSICRRKKIPKEEEIESLLGEHSNNCADCSHEEKDLHNLLENLRIRQTKVRKHNTYQSLIL